MSVRVCESRAAALPGFVPTPSSTGLGDVRCLGQPLAGTGWAATCDPTSSSDRSVFGSVVGQTQAGFSRWSLLSQKPLFVLGLFMWHLFQRGPRGLTSDFRCDRPSFVTQGN